MASSVDGLATVAAKADSIFFQVTLARCMLDESQRINRSVPIVAEAEQIAIVEIPFEFKSANF
jgi:hypothetical protein